MGQSGVGKDLQKSSPPISCHMGGGKNTNILGPHLVTQKTCAVIQIQNPLLSKKGGKRRRGLKTFKEQVRETTTLVSPGDSKGSPKEMGSKSRQMDGRKAMQEQKRLEGSVFQRNRGMERKAKQG